MGKFLGIFRSEKGEEKPTRRKEEEKDHSVPLPVQLKSYYQL